jgi:hypothetical protein
MRDSGEWRDKEWSLEKVGSGLRVQEFKSTGGEISGAEGALVRERLGMR